MKIRLTESQVQSVLTETLNKERLIDFLADDVEWSVDLVCEFIRKYVDGKTLQERIKSSFPPIQLDLFPD